ncbi:MAG: DeoR/GlpR transcriptional regulator [Bacteroidales bacterium]|nr:DeoR/GlpR transcriptional regulator [Bacteroidales bacterium]
MLNERQNRILKLLSRNDLTTVNELASKLNVSSVTIRQDLNFLEAEGLLRRVHGGAVLEDAEDLTNRLGFNYEKKLRIARKAAELVNDGETVLIESGSTNVLLARELVKKKNVTLITTNVFIARQFRKNEPANVILLGGLYQQESESMVGKITKVCLDQINFDKAFIGIDGYTSIAGFTLRDLFRAEISSYIIKKSTNTTIISDSSKFGKTELTNICYHVDIHHVVTDSELDKTYVDEFKKAGLDLLLA